MTISLKAIFLCVNLILRNPNLCEDTVGRQKARTHCSWLWELMQPRGWGCGLYIEITNSELLCAQSPVCHCIPASSFPTLFFALGFLSSMATASSIFVF